MKFAYADPPYPGQAKRWYGDHPDYAGEVDHAELIARLVRDYPDGWALSTSGTALQHVLALCPPDVKLAIWHVQNAEPPGGRATSWHLCWEPVIIRGGRNCGNRPAIRNLLTCPAPTGFRRGDITGQKPPAFSRWIFGLLGATVQDDLDDLFPGSGAVGREWEAYIVQPWFPAVPEPNDGSLARVRYARRLARSGAPTLEDS